jgi:hypothetical protein
MRDQYIVFLAADKKKERKRDLNHLKQLKTPPTPCEPFRAANKTLSIESCEIPSRFHIHIHIRFVSFRISFPFER